MQCFNCAELLFHQTFDWQSFANSINEQRYFLLIVAYTSTPVKYFRYVELLDKYFGSVCELDIIFNFEKAYFVLDELLIAGEVQVLYRIVSVLLLHYS